MAKLKEDFETIKFSKFHAASNDLILINNTQGAFNKFRDNAELISYMCSRRTGIGSDGLVELLSHSEHTFEMVFYKASSGERGRFGGNAARCACAFSYTLGLTKTPNFSFVGSDGIHQAYYDREAGMVEIDFGTIFGVTIYNYNEFFVDSGCPHHIIFLDPGILDTIDIIAHGKNVSEGSQYANIGGTNVNFVEKMDDENLRIRTYERGVQGEIPTCGTGSVACALANSVRECRLKRTGNNEMGPEDLNVSVSCPGGELSVKFKHETGTSEFTHIKLKGPVFHVYSGMLKVPPEFTGQQDSKVEQNESSPRP